VLKEKRRRSATSVNSAIVPFPAPSIARDTKDHVSLCRVGRVVVVGYLAQLPTKPPPSSISSTSLSPSSGVPSPMHPHTDPLQIPKNVPSNA
jgi:hypothetical protein